MQTSAEPVYYLPVHFKKPKVVRGPSPRNREIYDAVRVENLSYRAAAAKFNLSPARIGKVLEQVENWIGRTGGRPTRTWQERLRVSEYLHRGRAEVCFSKLSQAFDEGTETFTDRVRVFKGEPEERTVTKKLTKRDPRQMLGAWRIEEARRKFEHVEEPEPESMTAEERLREARVMTEEDLRIVAEEREARAKAESEEQRAEEVDDVVEMVAEDLRPEVEGEVVSPFAPFGEQRHDGALPPFGEQRHDGDELPGLPELPHPDEDADEDLENYWKIDEFGRKIWSPPTKYVYAADGTVLFSSQPLPPNPAVKRKKKPNGG